MNRQQYSGRLWQRFSNYDNTVDESTLGNLIHNNFVSLSAPGPCTHREIVERVAEGCNIRIQVQSLSDCLAQTVLPRGRVVFGCPGDFFDQISENYINMEWWLTDNGLNMAINPPLYQRLAIRLDECEGTCTSKARFCVRGLP